jgi:hypothetical protein
MYCILIVFFCIADISGTSLKPSTSIDKHATELAELIIETWSYRPALLRRTKPEVFCSIIDECCENEDRVEAISLIGLYSYGFARYHLNKVMKTCMNSTSSTKGKQYCSSFQEIIISQRTAYEDSVVKQYIDIIDSYEKDLLKMYFRISSSCNSQQIHALVCSSNPKLVEKCAEKMLHEIYDHHDYKNSQEIAMKIKQVLIELNQKLSEKLIKNIK